MRSKSLLLFCTGLLLALSATGGEFQAELEVTAPAGADRKAEPVCGGVPVPVEAGLKAGQAFAVFKGGRELPSQVLPLVKRADGTLRWVLVDFQDDMAAGKRQKYVLRAVQGSAKPAKPLSVKDTADAVAVDTGEVKFVISKTQPFGLFSSVEVGGKPVVSGGAIRLREHFTAKDYTAGKPQSVVVEYAGPMRTTICVKGSYVGDERGKLTYAARITAWAGKSNVFVKHSVCNSVEAHYSFRLIERSEIALKLAGKPLATLLGAGEPISAGADAWISQGYLSRAAGACTTSTEWKSKAGQNPGGWIAAKTAAGTVFASDRFFWADPARKLEIKSGELVLGGIIARPEAPNAKARPYADKHRVLYDCSHLSSEYMIDFAAPGEGVVLDRLARAGLERPWLLATPEAYLHGDAIFSGKFGTQADELACYDKWEWKYNKSRVPTGPERRYPRFFRGIDNHFDPENDCVDHLVMMWMRTGKRAYWSQLRSWANYWTDLCAWRTDGWRWKDGGVWKRSGPKGSHPRRPRDPVTGIRNIMPTGDGGSDGRTFNMKRGGKKKLPIKLSQDFVKDNYTLGIYTGCYCHNWSAGLLHLYCMTGDRDFLEAGLDRAEQGFDQECRAFGRKAGDGKHFSRSFTRTSMNLQAARMLNPEDEFFRKASEQIAGVFLKRKIREPRGLVNPAGGGLGKALGFYVGDGGLKALKESGNQFDRKSGFLSDKAGNKWRPVVQPAKWMFVPQGRAMYRYWLETGNEDAHDWVIAYGQVVTRVMIQRHGNFDYSRFLMDFPSRGVARDFGSWNTDPKTNKWAEGPEINSYLARFHPDICARAYTLTGEPAFKKGSYNLLFGGTHRGYNAPKMKALDRVGYWMNYHSDHDGQIDYQLHTFYVWAHERKDSSPPAAVKDLKVSVAGGEATVSFTAPADAGGGKVTRYQVKCSDKPIVGYIKFLEAYNSFKEAECTNWFMAANVTGEPAPKAVGAQESFTVKGVPAGAKYFAVRAYDDSSNRSALSNVAKP